MHRNKLGLGVLFFIALATTTTQTSAQTFDFNNGTEFAGGGIGTTMTAGPVTASIVDAFAPEFVDDGLGTFVQTANILRASEGDGVLAGVGSNSLGVNNPSVEDIDFFAGTGGESRDLNDGEGLVIEFDVDVVFTELDFQSLDDGTVTVTIEGIGSFDFVEDGTAGDIYANPFGIVLIPAGADVTFSMSTPAVASASARIADFTVATSIEDIPFNFAVGTAFDANQGIGTMMIGTSLDGSNTATVSIVDLFAPEFVGGVQTTNILSASAGDLVTSDIGSDSLGVDNPSISDAEFFGGAGIETRDFNDGEALVVEFDVDVSFTELNLTSLDDGVLTVTVPGVGSFDFVDDMTPGDQYADPFGLDFIPAGTDITFAFSSPAPAESGSLRISGFTVTTEPREVDALKGDVDLSGIIDFADIPAFIAVLQSGVFQAEADCDCSGFVDFSDIPAFILILQAG